MINDTLHIGDIVVGAKQPFSTENRQSYLILNLQNIQKREMRLLFIKKFTLVKLDVDCLRPSWLKQNCYWLIISALAKHASL